MVYMFIHDKKDPKDPKDNHPPDAIDDVAGKVPGHEVSEIAGTTILSNDSDPDGDAIDIVSVQNKSELGATVSFVNGVIQYDPTTSTQIQNLPAGETITDKVTYTIRDEHGGTDTATIFYTVTSPKDKDGNNPPVAKDDDAGKVSGSETNDLSTTVVLQNDNDPDGDDISIVAVDKTSALGATVLLIDTNSDGVPDTVRYNPETSQQIQNLPAGQTLTDTITYTISDGKGGTDTATITYTVRSPRDTGNGNGNPPDAVDDTIGTVPANSTTSTNQSVILSNDSDVEDTQAELAIQSVKSTSALGANVTFVNGQVVYDPSGSSNIQTILDNLPTNKTITDTVEYTLVDTDGNTDTATISYTLQGRNSGTGGNDDNPPDALSDDLGDVAKSAIRTTGFDTILANDTDVDGDTITVKAVEATSNLGATVTLVDTNGDNVPDSVRYDPSTSTSIQNLKPGESLTDSVIYTIEDENGNTDQATLFYTVKHDDDIDNKPPDAVNDDAGTLEADETKEITESTILGNDSDPDGDTLTITNVGNTSTLGGTVTFVNGVVKYDPSTSQELQNLPVGQTRTDTITYTISDGKGGTDTATISFTVNGTKVVNPNNNPPDAVDDQLGEVKATETKETNETVILGNDSDPDNDTLTITNVEGTSNLGATVTFVNGVVKYDPSTSTLLSNLADGQTVTDSVTYTISDGEGGTDTATLFYTVKGPGDGNNGNNNPPDALSDDLGKIDGDKVDETNVSEILANDSDPDGDDINVTAVEGTSNLGATVTLENGVVKYNPLTSQQIQDLPAGQSITDSVIYTITDEDGNTDQATLFYTVMSPNTVDPVNNPPDAVDDQLGEVKATETKETNETVILGNDSDPDNDTLTITNVEGTSNLGATVTFVNGVVKYDPSTSTLLSNLADGQTVTDSVTYTISDGEGGTDTATLFYTVKGPGDGNNGNNNPPDALSDDLGKIDGDKVDETNVSEILANDSDPDGDDINVTAVEGTSNLGATVTLENGVVKYNPLTSQQIQDLPAGQSITDSVIYTITDEDGNTDQATLFYTVMSPNTVDPVNNPPDAVDDQLGEVKATETKETNETVILGNDSDPDNDTLTITNVEGTSNLGATVTFVNGVVKYDPSTSTLLSNLADGQTVTDSVTYTISDGEGGTDTATLFYTVKGPGNGNNGNNNPPDALSDDLGKIDGDKVDETNVSEILANDSDPDGDDINVTAVEGTSNLGATVTLENGVVKYNPLTSQQIQDLPAGQSITDSVIYTITDEDGNTDQATLFYTVMSPNTVDPVNNPPDAVDDQLGEVKATETKETNETVILGNDSDPDNDTLTITNVEGTSNLGATVTFVNGVVKYDPSTSTLLSNLADGQTVTDSVTYTISDGEGGTDTATLFYTVKGPGDGNNGNNNPPDALSDDLGKIDGDKVDETNVSEILANDSDPDGDDINVTAVEGTSNLGATVTLENGVVKYNPLTSQQIQDLPAGQSITDSVIYTITDEDGNTDQATLFYTVMSPNTVDPVNNPPDAVDDQLGEVKATETKETNETVILGNDSDPDNDTLTITNVEGTSNLGATVTFVNGVVKYDPSTSTLLSNLADGQTVTDSVTYTISDGEGGTDTATLFYTVKGPGDGNNGNNNPPDALSDDLGKIDGDKVDETNVSEILANDSDPDGDDINVTAVEGTSNLGATVTLENGVVKYNPLTSQQIQDLPAGQSITDSVIYTITDEDGNTDQATLFYTVMSPNTVDPVNNPPDAVDDAIGTVPSDASSSTDESVILANDTDVDPNDDPVIQSVDDTSNLGATVSFVNGQVVYDPSGSSNIQTILANLPSDQSITDTVEYTIVDKDGNSDTATISYTLQGKNTGTGNNNPPDAVDDAIGTVPSDASSSTDESVILANDTDVDPNDDPVIQSVDDTSNLGATVSFVNGQVVYDPSGSSNIQTILANLPSDQSITDTVEYTIVDKDGNTDTATISYTLQGKNTGTGNNNPPDAVDDAIGTVPSDASSSTDESVILANDTDVDPNDDPVIQSVDDTSNLGATVSFVNGQVVYDPSGSSNIQTILANLPSDQSITDTVEYTIVDKDGNTDTATISYTLQGKNTSTGNNNPPDAVDDDQGTVPGDDTTTVTLADILSNDSDPDGDPLAVTNIDATSNLGASITFADTDGDGLVDEFTYDPSTSDTIQKLAPGETVTDTITYTITDEKGGFDTATISFTVTAPEAVNNDPDAVKDKLGQIEGDAVTTTDVADILANDSDPDGDNLEVISLDGQSEFGATITPVIVNGVITSFTYDPSTSVAIQHLAPGESIEDTLTYTISDGNGGTDTAEICFTVMSPNVRDNTVVAEDDHLTVWNNETSEGGTSILLANDFDPEGDNFAITAADATSALGASVSLVDTDGNGIFDKISYDPSSSAQLSNLKYGECVTDSFTYTITDENGATDTATVFLTVEGGYQDNDGGCRVVETSCWGGSWGNWKDLFNKDFVHQDTSDSVSWKDAMDMMGSDHDHGHSYSYSHSEVYSKHGKDIYDDAKNCVDDSHWDSHDGHHNNDC